MIHAWVDGSYFPEQHTGIICYQIENQQPFHQCISSPLGTNNQMEYLAIFNLLNSLKDFEQVEINTDSALASHQLSGEWRILNRELQTLYDKIMDTIHLKHLSTKFIWIPREQNLAGIFLEKNARRILFQLTENSVNSVKSIHGKIASDSNE